MKNVFFILLFCIASGARSQYGGLPDWPFVIAAKDYISGIDNLSGTNISTYTPHVVLKWGAGNSGNVTDIPNTTPVSGPDNVGVTQAGFNGCGEFAFFVLHTGVNSDINGLELYSPAGEILLGKNTSPAAPNANYADDEVQIIRRPGFSSQWFLVYTNQDSDPYSCEQIFYSLITLECGVMDYVTLNNVLQKDVLLTAPVVGGTSSGAYAGRFYTHGKAVSRTSKTGGNTNQDLYLHRRYDTGFPVRVNNTTFSIDRFEVSTTGISWVANSGIIPSYSWGLLAAGSPMELSPTENRLAVMARNGDPNMESIYIFDLTVPSGLGNGVGDYENIKLDQLLVTPDIANAATVGYTATLNDLSTYQTVQTLATTSTYLSFLKNMDRKISSCEFSFDGNSLYVGNGGYVQSAYGNLTYLGQIDLTSSYQGNHPIRLQIQMIDGWRQNDGRQTNYWGSYLSNTTIQNYRYDCIGVTNIQSSINGNLYFTKVHTDTLFSIPNPNAPLPVNLIPGYVDLSTTGTPNIKLPGFVYFIPDQIDGYDYLSADFQKIDIPVQHQKIDVCNLTCDTIVISVVNKLGEEICTDSALTCPDLITLCLSNTQSYDLVGSNGKVFIDAIVNGVMMLPNGATVFDFTPDSILNFTCCPEINLGNDTSFCLNSFSLPLDVTTINATYKWQDGSTNSSFSVNGAGDYWVIVTVNNCSDTDSISVVQTSNLSFTLGPDTAVCPGQNVTLEPTTSISNATYNWNNGGGTSPTFITNTAGQVTVEITNQSGCVGRDTIQIINDNPLTIDLGVDLVTCFGDSIKLELSPPRENLNYSWNIGGTLISSDSSIMVGTLGTIPYVLNVDSANCTASDAITVTVYALPTVSLGNDTFLCANANSNIVLDAGSGQTDYIWSQGGTTQTITINSVNEYSVIVTDANLCQATDTILVVVQSPNTIDIGPDQTMCPGGTIQIDLDNVNLNEAGASWVWVNDNSTGPNYLVQNLNAGDTATVIINYTNTFGCVSADSSLVTINQNLQIVGLSDLIPCERETATLTTPVNANYSYSWFIGGILTATPAPNNVLSIPALVANDIISVQLQITDNVLGCAGDTTITITVNPIPKPVLSDVNICSGVQTTLDPALAPPYTFYWTENGAPMTPLSSTTQTITGSSAGSVTYNVQVTDPTTSCSNDTFAVVTTRPPPAYTLSDLTPTVICEGRQKTLSTGMDTSLYTHLWTKGGVSISNSDNTIFITESDTYKVTVTEKSSSCAQGSNIAIQYIPPPVVDLNIANNFDLCDESEVSLKNLNYNPAIQSLWSTGAVNVEEIIITQFGVYWLKESVGACSDSDGVVILHRELPLSGLGPDTALCFDDLFSKQMTLDTKQNTGSHLWSTGDTSRSIQISIPGLYSVLITSEYGCITDDEIVVLEHCLPNLWVPNVFSPNGDGKNDYWSPVMKNLDDVELWVYNRWGEQIWKGNSQESAWDGKYKNRPVAQDVYVWKISYSFYDELQTKTKKTRVGIVTIIR